MYCPNCGSRIPDGAGFCPNCGAPQSTGTASGPAPHQPWHDADPASYPKRKGPPIFLFMVLAVVAVAAGVVGYFVRQSALEKDPLHGAKLKEKTVLEQGGLQVKVTGLRYDPWDSPRHPYAVDLELKNTGSQTARVRCAAAAVNSIRVGTKLAEEIPAGSTARASIWLEDRDMSQRMGLERIASFDFVLGLSSGGGETLTDVLHLETGLKQPEKNLGTRGDELYNAGGIRVIYTTVYPSYSDTATGLEFYVENNTDMLLTVRGENVRVKGAPIQGAALEESLLPRTCGYVNLTVDREEAGPAGELGEVQADLMLSDARTQRTLATIPAALPVH